METSPRPNPSRRRRRPGAPSTTAAAAAVLAFGMLTASSSFPLAAAQQQQQAAQQSSMTIQAVPDSSQLSSKGSQAGCDHYRNGYLGLALCVNFYDDHANGKPVVQVVGSLTNEGQVDICNMTLAIEGLAQASYRSPTWLPTYPAKQSFKAGTYFPFTVILPVDPNSLSAYSYPSVDVVKGFYACDASLKALPEDQVVPPPGTGRSSIEADDDYPGSGPKSGLNSKIKWNTGFLASAGSNTDCLGGCLGTLNKQTDDCVAAAYVLHSGCIKTCPPTVAQWTVESCTAARCKADQCTLKTSGAPHRHAAGQSAVLALLATAAALFLGSGGGAALW